MTKKQPETGSVFHFPYLWRHEKDRGWENQKNSTVCLIVKIKHQTGDDYNIDVLQRSWNYDPRAKIFGRFGKAFTEKISSMLSQAIKSGLSQRIDRT